MQPRLIRFKDAPAYVGMDKHRFNEVVRPYLIEIPIGKQGIAFDRLDLDSWVDQYKQCSGRPAGRSKLWGANEHQVSTLETGSGTLIKKYTDADYVKVQERLALKKPKSTWQNGSKK